MLRKHPKTLQYTLKEVDEEGSPTLTVKPPKYSPQDKYAKYRRAYKEQQ